MEDYNPIAVFKNEIRLALMRNHRVGERRVKELLSPEIVAKIREAMYEEIDRLAREIIFKNKDLKCQ